MIATAEQTKPAATFPKTQLAVWRDERDDEHITIGSVTTTHTPLGKRRRYTAWMSFHIDALLFLADRRVYDRVRNAEASEFPMPIELAIEIRE